MIGRQVADPKLRFFLNCELLPGDEVRVMLESSDDDLISRADIRATICRCNEIDRLGRSTSEDQAVGVSKTDELCDTLSRGVIAVSSLDRQRIRTAMRICIAGLI